MQTTVHCAVCTGVVFVAPVTCCSVNCTSALLLNFTLSLSISSHKSEILKTKLYHNHYLCLRNI